MKRGYTFCTLHISHISADSSTYSSVPWKPQSLEASVTSILLIKDSQTQPIKFYHNLWTICIEREIIKSGLGNPSRLPFSEDRIILRKCRHVCTKIHSTWFGWCDSGLRIRELILTVTYCQNLHSYSHFPFCSHLLFPFLLLLLFHNGINY